jgi:hypothetical protein
MRSMLAVCPLLVVVAGCTSSVQSLEPSGSSSSTGSTGSTGSTSSSSSGAPFDAGGVVESYTTGMGPIQLGPGVEETNCITIHLGNTAGGFVRRFRADLQPGSHHMIVYTSDDTTESPTPTPCIALSGILMGEHPVFIAQQPEAELLFPDDENGTPVGFELQANQMVKVEFHTINTTQAPISVSGTAYIDTIPLTTTVTQSDLAFWGTEKIQIPALGSFDTGVLWQQALPGTKSFAVTTHQHHLGTQMQIWYGTGATDTSDRVANSTDWSNPPLVLLDPPLDFPANGNQGLAYECHWNNPTTSPVSFGEGYNDEMCFLWHYYYPSQGFEFCVDGKCY